jgi:uncharacterized protein YpuA (DUF1002 family)
MKQKKTDEIKAIEKKIKKQYRKNNIELSKTDLNNLVMIEMASDKPMLEKVTKESVGKYKYNVEKINKPDGTLLILEKDF